MGSYFAVARPLPSSLKAVDIGESIFAAGVIAIFLRLPFVFGWPKELSPFLLLPVLLYMDWRLRDERWAQWRLLRSILIVSTVFLLCIQMKSKPSEFILPLGVALCYAYFILGKRERKRRPASCYHNPRFSRPRRSRHPSVKLMGQPRRCADKLLLNPCYQCRKREAIRQMFLEIGSGTMEVNLCEECYQKDKDMWLQNSWLAGPTRLSMR